MTIRSFDYVDLFRKMLKHLITACPQTTKEITESVKVFFQKTYGKSHIVHCSHSCGSEFIADVLVTTFNPKVIVKARSLELSSDNISVFLAVKSELGGTGASSAYGVMKNVVEDYLKLLIIRCAYRAMVFTSLPYSGEGDHVANRAETLRELYSRSPGIDGGALLVHLKGSKPKSTQVQAQVAADAIRGFVISTDGKSVNEITKS